MARLTWGAVGTRYYEAGVDRGVLYIDGVGVAWSGLVSVDENPSGGDSKPFYLDGVMYLNYSAREEFGATLNAYYSPREFDVCDGITQVKPGLYASQQKRKTFGLSYRSLIGNDVQGNSYGYKIHIIYNALAAPTQRNHNSLSDKTDASLLSWAVTVKPVVVPGAMRSAHLTIDTSTASPGAVSELEAILYGSDAAPPRLPDPTEIATIFEDVTDFIVTDLGSGAFQIMGSDAEVVMLDTGIYQITDAGVIDEGSGVYQITSP